MTKIVHALTGTAHYYDRCVGPMQGVQERVKYIYSALSPVFSTNVVCVKTQQKHARIKHHDRTKQ